LNFDLVILLLPLWQKQGWSPQRKGLKMRIAWLRKKSLFFSLTVLLAWGTAIPGYAQQNLLPLRLDLEASLNKLIFVVASEEGIFKKNGLDVQIFILPVTSDGEKRSGIQIASQYLRAADDNAPIVIFGGGVTIVNMMTNARAVKRVILASTDDMANYSIISRNDITKPEQLKGKRLGYSTFGTTSHYEALVFVKKMGWDPNLDISLMNHAMDVEILQKGGVDAFVTDELGTAIGVAAGFHQLVNFYDWKIPMVGSSVTVDQAWLKENRETARRFIKSTVDAIALMKNDRDVAFRSMTRYYNLNDREKLAKFYGPMLNLPRKPYPAVEGIKRQMEAFDSHEMRQHKPEDFYDDRFVRELDQSGYIDGLYK
jgi:ABC-type nitrate/sulfonate/bicarbonate transport system substrate-binding protein